MAKLDMEGPFPLNDAEIDRQVTRKSPGNYGLGYTKDNGTFIVEYVGRSDDDVNNRLHDWTGKKYKKFKYSYAANAKEAYEKECRNYHDFGGSDDLDNDIHPARPSGTSLKCPVCNH
ncbi:MAG TPA: hypothetical protein ENI68_01505 [Gammaproteobacteria bacterium]|nr:hypothetical protein [Gammaproteobacteria bacterium]